MRIRLAITLALAVLLTSCGEDEGYFSTITTGTSADSTADSVDEGASSTTSAATTTTRTGETTTAPVTMTEWTWSRLSAPVVGGTDDQYVSAVTSTGPGLVAVGSEWMGEEFDAAVWTSPDGLTWSRVPHDGEVFGGPDYQRMFGVTAGGPGLVAVGIDGSGGDWDAAVWTSSDGVTWSRVPHDEVALGGAGDQEITAMAAVWAGLVAVGYDGTDDDWDAAAWTSVDGVTWQRVPDEENAFGGAGDQWMSSVCAGGPGLVAVGTDYSDGDGKPAVWTSPDGLSWSRVAHDEAVFGGAGDQTMAAVTAAGGGLVAVGRDESGGDVDGAVWTSVDGLTWSRVAHDEAVFGGPMDQRMRGVVAGGPGVVVIGEYDTGDHLDGAIWVAVPAG